MGFSLIYHVVHVKIQQYNVSVKPVKPVITRPQPVDSVITGTNGTPQPLACLSVGGYPRQTVGLYIYRTGQNHIKLGDCNTASTVNQGLYDVTETCSLTPTQEDKGALLYCQSSYTGEPTLLEKSDEVLLQFLSMFLTMLLKWFAINLRKMNC